MVFIAPPWWEIFHQDAERQQDFDTARRACEAMRAAYTALGYQLVDIPCAPVSDRANVVRAQIGERSGG